MPNRLRQGDLVTVVSGDDRGKRGRILRVVHEKNRVIVEGVNLVFKHLRRSQQNPQGGRVRREAPIATSNVMPIDPETNKATRVSTKVVDGRRTRVGRKSGAALGAGAPKKGGRKSGGKEE
jgi:large subunit ribosomal protein L24